MKRMLSLVLCVLLLALIPAAMAEEATKEPVLTLMPAELPEWALVYNDTAEAPLKVQNLMFRVFSDDTYINTLLGIDVISGTVEYDDMTGEYTLSEGGVVIEEVENYTFLLEQEDADDIEMILVEWEDDRTAVAALDGEAEILASGIYPMTINFTMTLFDNGTFELANKVSPTTISGTWETASDGSVVVTSENLTMLYSMYDADHHQASLAVKASLNEYEFTLILKGRF